MKIKVGNKLFSSNNEPIMVILTEQDKQNIANMPSEATKYCQYNKELYSFEEIQNWMK